MTTFVGKQKNFDDALYELCSLDYDAIEAYKAAINRLKSEEYKNKLTAFKLDHQRHCEELTALMKTHNKNAPTGADMKSMLTQGKVVLATIAGDRAILKAMLSNEQDTNVAYEHMIARSDKWPDAEHILSQGLADEKKHKEWLELAIHELKE